MPTEEHSLIAGNLYAALRAFVKPRGLGRVLFEARHQLPNDSSNARLPDVEFTRAERLQPVVTQGGIVGLPDLAVEIKSPSDRYPDLRKKAVYYLDHGVQVVWLIDPAKQQIEVWTNDTTATLTATDTLTGGDLLPGFALAVLAVFET